MQVESLFHSEPIVTPLHTNGSLEEYNVTALIWVATFYYEALLDIRSTVKLNAMH